MAELLENIHLNNFNFIYFNNKYEFSLFFNID